MNVVLKSSHANRVFILLPTAKTRAQFPFCHALSVGYVRKDKERKDMGIYM